MGTGGCNEPRYDTYHLGAAKPALPPAVILVRRTHCPHRRCPGSNLGKGILSNKPSPACEEANQSGAIAISRAGPKPANARSALCRRHARLLHGAIEPQQSLPIIEKKAGCTPRAGRQHLAIGLPVLNPKDRLLLDSRSQKLRK